MMQFKQLSFLAIFLLSGCVTGSSLESRHATATEIARAARMTEKIIPSGIFSLTVWERRNNPEAPVNVYIEGDGLAWLNTRTKSMNPTPPDPLALRLAAADVSDNVVYIARPCQYTGLRNPEACPDTYWTNGRTAPEVISAYQQALDSIKTTKGLNLTGYSGGAAVAVLVAAGRSDILSLRTVAGNTGYATFTALHGISPLDASLDPASVAAKIAHIPQLHFIGEEDKIVPVTIFNSWKQASGASSCVHAHTVSDTSHEKGWPEKWPELLRLPVECRERP